jgi:hypothetical protein
VEPVQGEADGKVRIAGPRRPALLAVRSLLVDIAVGKQVLQGFTLGGLF